MANQFSYKYTETDYINKCNDFGVQYIGYRKEKKKGTIIQFICPKHESKGVQEKDWSHFRTYKYGCSYCSGRGKTTEEVQREVVNNNVKLISEYKGNEKPIECECKQCGNTWTTLPKVLVTNGSGCPKCGKKKAILSETKTQKEFEEEMSIINPDIQILGKYINTHTKIKCNCKICTHIWYGYPANLLNKSTGCPNCSASNGEKELLRILSDMRINYIHQYVIDDCVYERKLKFDAFDIDNNIAFEYNGEQHYRPVDFAGKGEAWAKKQFELTQNRDRAKKNYCNKNNIPIIIIPYWERSNMREIIEQNLKELMLKIA